MLLMSVAELDEAGVNVCPAVRYREDHTRERNLERTTVVIWPRWGRGRSGQKEGWQCQLLGLLEMQTGVPRLANQRRRWGQIADWLC